MYKWDFMIWSLSIQSCGGEDEKKFVIIRWSEMGDEHLPHWSGDWGDECPVVGALGPHLVIYHMTIPLLLSYHTTWQQLKQ